MAASRQLVAQTTLHRDKGAVDRHQHGVLSVRQPAPRAALLHGPNRIFRALWRPKIRSTAFRTPWTSQQTSGGKGGNLQSLGNRALFDDGAKRRKPGGNWRKPRHEPPNRFLRKIQGGAERAERSETPRTHPARWSRQHYRSPATHTAAAGLRRSAWWKLPARTLAREPVRSFAVSPTGCSPNPDWRVTCGNCANCASRRLPAGPNQWTQLGGDQHFSSQCFFTQCFQELSTSRTTILRLASGVIALSHLRNRTVTCAS